MEEAITGVTVSNTGGLGWLDGIRDRVFGVADLFIAREFPEQLTHSGANEVVQDTEVEAAKAASSFLNPDNLVRLGLVAAAVIGVVIVLKNR